MNPEDDDAVGIINQFDHSDMQYLHLRTPKFELTLSRLVNDVEELRSLTPISSMPSADEDTAWPDVSESPTPREDEGVASGDNGKWAEQGVVTVDAPTIGVFYRAPAPHEAPYVEVGDSVTEDTTVGLIEAMKVYTAVSAGAVGVVDAVLVENGEFVEFGQPVIALRSEDG